MLESTIPFPIVVATATLKTKAPIKFQKAASSTAFLGFSTPVATTVAIELAVSWKPFIKSNTNAIIMTMITKVKSGMLYHNAFDDATNHFTLVCDFLQKLVNFLVLYNVYGVLIEVK